MWCRQTVMSVTVLRSTVAAPLDLVQGQGQVTLNPSATSAPRSIGLSIS